MSILWINYDQFGNDVFHCWRGSQVKFGPTLLQDFGEFPASYLWLVMGESEINWPRILKSSWNKQVQSGSVLHTYTVYWIFIQYIEVAFTQILAVQYSLSIHKMWQNCFMYIHREFFIQIFDNLTVSPWNAGVLSESLKVIRPAYTVSAAWWKFAWNFQIPQGTEKKCLPPTKKTHSPFC